MYFSLLSQYADMEPTILDEYVTSGRIHSSPSKVFVFFLPQRKKTHWISFLLDIYVKAGISSMLLYEFSRLRGFLL